LAVSADAIEAALQFAGILAANLSAMGVHPIAQLGRTKRKRLDVKPLLQQAFDLVARLEFDVHNPLDLLCTAT
jgi:hypothetical protein